jgi:hypothetical protein
VLFGRDETAPLCDAIGGVRSMLGQRDRAAALPDVVRAEESVGRDPTRAVPTAGSRGSIGVIGGCRSSMASAADPEPAVSERSVAAVTSQPVARTGGEHAARAIARRVALVGGAVSASIDAFPIYAIARFADRGVSVGVTVERV